MPAHPPVSGAAIGLPTLTRRGLLAAAPALSLLPADSTAIAADPIVPIYQEWLEARRAWRDLEHLPSNGNWDDPRSLSAEAREYSAEERMLERTPTSKEGIAALAALAWVFVKPESTIPQEFELDVQRQECRAIIAIWRACTGRNGYPTT